jgi:endonuclease/exonuclease/phosphatase family metal-dependent hydrolase
MFKQVVSATFLLFSLSGFAQEQVTLMCYNVLNFPTGNIEGREDTLRHIINFVEPDLFLIQELKNDSGLQLILNESFADLQDEYAASTFLSQQSNPSSDFKLQQAIIYNTRLFGLSDEGFLQTGTRDINRFKLYYKDPALNSGTDTVFLHVFVAHFKSSQGSVNMETRLSNAQTFTTQLVYLPEDANVILGGDFNLYTSDEPAYQELLDPTNYIRLTDPINSPGNWSSSSFEPKSILTQSTRASSIFGDGAGGGVDDRFDFMLLSENMFQNWNTVVYEDDSYYALGNTGSCYNQSITNCDGGEWSNELLSSLYYMSDHLPVILKLNLGVGSVDVEEKEQNLSRLELRDGALNFVSMQQEPVTIIITDVLGRTVFRTEMSAQIGENAVPVLTDYWSGIYLINLQSRTQNLCLRTKF